MDLIVEDIMSNYERTLRLQLNRNAKFCRRIILYNIIDCICNSITGRDAINCIDKYCVTFKDMFKYILSQDRDLDKTLKSIRPLDHLELMQRYLFQSMLEVCQERISEEIERANFLAVIVEDASGTCDCPYFVVILRYIAEGKVVERFWSFVNHQNHYLAEYILEVMAKLKVNENPRKLIAQAYDGTPQLAGIVREQVKAVYPHAHYVHSHAFDLDLVMKRASSDNRQVRIFFANVECIREFFEICTKAKTKYLAIIFPDKNMTLSESIRIIFENRTDIIKCINLILDDETVRNVEILSRASGLVAVLQNYNFIYWLSLFRMILPFVDLLPYEISMGNVEEGLRRFEQNMLMISDIWTDTDPGHPGTGNQIGETQLKKTFESLITETKTRFEHSLHQSIRRLFETDKYEEYKVRFPEDVLRNVCDHYDHLDINGLRTELETIYKSLECKGLKTNQELYQIFKRNELPEVTKLMEIFLTVPTESPGMDWSVVERARRFPMKSPNRHYELNSLAMVMIERDFIKSIPGFQDRVIAKFDRYDEWKEYFYLR